MGRRKDAPALQAAKGYPGKRRKAVDRALADVDAAKDAVARDLAADDPTMPPALLLEPRFGPSLEIWRDVAARLRKVSVLQATDRHALMVFCVNFALWESATRRLMREGLTYQMKSTTGSTWKKENPLFSMQGDLTVKVMEGFKRFGLSPTDRYALFKDFAAAAAAGSPANDLFSPRAATPGPTPGVDPVDQIAALDSEPPPGLPN